MTVWAPAAMPGPFLFRLNLVFAVSDKCRVRVSGSIWIATGAIGLIAVYLCAGDVARVVVHWGVSQVCHGVSSGKVMFALVFMAVFALRAAWVRVPGVGVRDVWVCAGVVGVGLLAALGSCVLYMRELGLSSESITLHWRDGVSSMNALTHTHTSKAVIAEVLKSVGLGSVGLRFDTGAPYAGIVPVWMSVIVGVSFVGTLALAMWHGPRGAAMYPARERSAAVMVLGLALASVCKSILDGGPLAYDAVIGGIAGLALMRSVNLRGAVRWVSRNGVLVGCVLVGWLGIVWGVSPGSLLHQAEHGLYRAAVYAGIVAIGLWRVEDAVLTGVRGRWVLGAGTAAVMGVAGWFAIGSAFQTIVPLLDRPPVTSAVVLRSGDGGVRAEHVNVESAGTALGAYRSQGDDGLRVRRTSLAPRPGRATGMYVDLIVLDRDGAADRPPMVEPSEVLKIKRIRRVKESELALSERGVRWTLQVEFGERSGPVVWNDWRRGDTQIDENERHIGYLALDAQLRASGVREYVIVPYGLYVAQPRAARAVTGAAGRSGDLKQAGFTGR